HTTVETESVRYVYQPIDQLYLVLLTNRQSNILQDLDTLRLLARVVSDQCDQGATVREISANAFELADAFDEVIGLGYRENVTLQQVRTILEMDSHEERIQEIIEKNKEKEATAERKRRAKELDAQRREMAKRGISASGGTSGFSSIRSNSSTIGSGAGYGENSMISSSIPASMPDYDRSTYTSTSATSASSKSKGMQLGAKAKASSFMDALGGDAALQEALLSSGIDEAQLASAEALVAAQVEEEFSEPHEDIHAEIEEKISVTANRDGGLDNMEVRGALIIHVADTEKARVKLELSPLEDSELQFKLHPNMDKKAFSASNTLVLKDPSRPFPINTPLAVVKWRLTTKDEGPFHYPVRSFNCWPSPSGNGACDVNIEYELEMEHLTLRNLVIGIPYPSGATPSVNEADGNYEIDDSRGLILWRIDEVNAEHRNGQLEFSVNRGGDDADTFFPVQATFSLAQSYARAEVESVKLVDTEEEIIFSTETNSTTDEYSIV
ncbi:Mu homology domain-containing protein, partial [Syncephalis plumigaleata]